MRKKTINRLKAVRVILAVILFIPILFFFLDFTDLLPDSLSKLLRRQLMPAILTGATATLVSYFLLTLLFGRIYCSVICPAGILQDLFNRIACIGKKKKMRFRYHKPANRLRYVILGLIALTAVFGITELCLLLDPYSNFGRIATGLFRPAVVWINNILADFLSSKGDYSFYHVTVRTSTVALISAVAAFLVFAVMAYFRGRLFCNTVCPVGALLSLVSRYSLFRITFDKDKCNHCTLCERNCKAEAIDSKNGTVDASSCVTCFNCTSACNRNSLKYTFAPPSWKKTSAITGAKKAPLISKSRRSFITTGAALAGSVPLTALANEKFRESAAPVTPPGSLSIERFKNLCTGCHLCVVQCPTQVLHPAGLKYGLGYMLKPYMSYESSYCNYSCTVCSEVCPTDAIKPVTVEEKKVTQIGIAHFYKEICVVYTDENDCGACSEHCPLQAVHMVPYKGTLTIPQVEAELCVGCGGCESICPVRPVRAIVILSNPVHQTIQLPEEEEVKEFEVDDFGF
ncbi:MAG: 4Fe-4S dicluster domain-containing protein [Tannerella sp.]|jgi:polyferredoxin|nr:4Fe-4S dicluster domain-containing protein [Tannerella sp.]